MSRLILANTRTPTNESPPSAKKLSWIPTCLIPRDFDVEVSNRLHFCKHHLAHLYRTWYPSGFSDALVLCIDGYAGSGDRSSGTAAHCQGGEIKVLRHLTEMQSLGAFYAWAMPLLGYRIFDEYKAMGLAPYGDPAVFEKLFAKLYACSPKDALASRRSKRCLAS